MTEYRSDNYNQDKKGRINIYTFLLQNKSLMSFLPKIITGYGLTLTISKKLAIFQSGR